MSQGPAVVVVMGGVPPLALVPPAAVAPPTTLTAPPFDAVPAVAPLPRVVVVPPCPVAPPDETRPPALDLLPADCVLPISTPPDCAAPVCQPPIPDDRPPALLDPPNVFTLVTWELPTLPPSETAVFSELFRPLAPPITTVAPPSPLPEDA